MRNFDKIKQRSRIPIFIIFFILLVGCSQAIKQDHPLTLTPTIQLLITVSPTPTGNATMAIPSATTISTSTITPTFRSSSIWTPRPSRTPLPTGVASLADYVNIEQSPDGLWFWGNSEQGRIEDQTHMMVNSTRFISVDGKYDWEIEPQKEQMGGNSYDAVGYHPIFWMPGQPFVYLTGTVCCIDGRNYFYTGMNLVRLDLRTGLLSQQLFDWQMRDLKFSPKGGYLFEARAWEPELRIHRLSDWSVIKIPLPPNSTRNGDAVWSPDSQWIIVQSCKDQPNPSTCDSTSLLLVNSKDGNYRVLVAELFKALGTERFIRTQMDWEEPTIIRVTERFEENPRHWIIDVTSGAVTRKEK